MPPFRTSDSLVGRHTALLRRACIWVAAFLAVTRAWGLDRKPIEGPPILQYDSLPRSEADIALSVLARGETIVDSPNIITVVSRDEIAQRGFRSLDELVDWVVGFHVSRQIGPLDIYRTRGVNNSILLLVNGVPIVNPLNNRISLDYSLPIDQVDRIELIDGPGGIRWGPYALLGLINVILARPTVLTTREVHVSEIDLKAHAVSAASSNSVGDWTTRIGISVTSSVEPDAVIRFPLLDANDDNQNHLNFEVASAGRTDNRPDIFWDATLQAETDGIQILARIAGEKDYSGVNSSGVLLPEAENSQVSDPFWLLSMKLFGQLLDQYATLESSAVLHRYRETNVRQPAGDLVPFGARDRSSIDVAVVRHKATLQRGDTATRTQQIFGVEHGVTFFGTVHYLSDRIADVDFLDTGGQTVEHDASAFAWIKQALLPRVMFEGGVRVGTGERAGTVVVDEENLIWQLSDQRHIKVGHKTGFRPPNLQHQYSDIQPWGRDVIVRKKATAFPELPNDALEAERSDALQLEYFDRWALTTRQVLDGWIRLGYAFTRVSHLIVRRVEFEDIAIWDNISTDSKIHSGSISFGMNFSPATHLIGSYTHHVIQSPAFPQLSNNPSPILESDRRSPDGIARLAVLANLSDQIDTSLALMWLGPRHVREPNRTAFSPGGNFAGSLPVDLGAAWLLSLALRAKDVLNGLDLQLKADNLLDWHFDETGSIDQEVGLTASRGEFVQLTDYPQPGRRFTLSLTGRF